jgi:glycosyltransferase involved in cell wall biosynthesis
MKLNWFSPLPPAKTDVGHFTSRILPALTKHVPVTLWTNQSEWDPSLNNYAQVRHYQLARMPWSELNRADMTIYNTGNNPLFHGAIWEVSQRHPGVVVLHDYNLQEFFYSLYLDPWQDLNGYLVQMEYYYGKKGRVNAESAFNQKLLPSLIEPYPLTRLGVENALGVLVHTNEALERLQQEATCPVAYAPLPFTPMAAAKPTVRAVGPPYRLIVFGYLGPNRRIEQLLKVLSEFSARQEFQLDVYGELANKTQLRKAIRQLQLEKQVTFYGFVPESELEQALAMADLAINLRYPSAGEASGSQLRIWSHALPTLVTKVGWYATLPENTVNFVRPTHELEDIRDHLKAFFSDPASFAESGRNGFALYRQQHLPEQYVQRLLTLVEEAKAFRSVSGWQRLVFRARLAMWNSFAGSLSNDAWSELLNQSGLKDTVFAEEWRKRMNQKAALVYGRTLAGREHSAFTKRLKRFIRLRLPPRVYEYYVAKSDSLLGK